MINKRAMVGMKQYVGVANPAAGAPIAIFPGAGVAWRVLSLDVLFTTDATVANRQVSWSFFTGTDALGVAYLTFVQMGSIARTIHLISGVSVGAYLTLTHAYFACPAEVWINSGFGLLFSADSLQAGDQFSGCKLLVELWYDD